jgi:prophage DNA circulation protein
MINDLFNEKVESNLVAVVVLTCIVFSVAQEARILANMTFVSRDEIEETMVWLRDQYDAVKRACADHMDNASYAAVTKLTAVVVHHLVNTARPLARVVNFQIRPLPSLAWANRIYGDALRAEELAKENRIVHPAFMPAAIRALSA